MVWPSYWLMEAMVAIGAGAVFVDSDILRIYLDLDYRIGRAAAGCAV